MGGQAGIYRLSRAPGLDIAKNVFQVHAVDAQGALVVAKPVRRGQLLAFFASPPRCRVGLEACSSVHHWARARPLTT